MKIARFQRRTLPGAIIILAASLACTAAPAPAPTAAPAAPAQPAQAVPAQPAKELQKIALRLEWTYWGGHAPFLVAIEKGFYARQGLDVTVAEGKGSGNTVTLVGEGKEDFGHVDASTAALSISKGLPAMMVAVMHGQGPTSAIFVEGTEIKTPKDLEGKTIALTQGAASGTAWPVFVAKTGIDASKIEIQNLPGDAKTSALLAGKIDANVSQGFYEIPILASKGVKANDLLFADYGANLLNYGIVTSKSMLEERPEVVRGFLAATFEGYDYTFKNLNEAMAIFQRRVPVIEVTVARQQLLNQQRQFHTKNTQDKPLGWQSIDDWNETLDILHQYGGMDQRLPAERYFTNQLLPGS